MFLLKIADISEKNNGLNIDFRIRDICQTMSDIKKVDEILSLLSDIDQPITMDKSSIFQLCCQYSLNTQTPEYLLKLYAPDINYIDANGCSCYNYIDDNIYPDLRPKLHNLIKRYGWKVSPENQLFNRRQLGWEWMKK